MLLLPVAIGGLAGCGGGGGGGGEDTETDAEGQAAADEGTQGGDQQDSTSKDESETEEASITPLERRTVEIYFPSLIEDGLVSEFREIFNTATPGDQIKQIVADLISGPTSEEATWAVPGGARLRQAYVLGDGTAWLDFSSELTDGIRGGSMNELLTVYAIVNSVVVNVPDVERVGILVNGRPVESLNGHIHLLNPLGPNFNLILGSITVRGPAPPGGALDRRG
jgi:spore germination protein GerM